MNYNTDMHPVAIDLSIANQSIVTAVKDKRYNTLREKQPKIHIASKINSYINTDYKIRNNNFSLREVKIISSGGSAEVYLVIDDKTKKKYAFKKFFSGKDLSCELCFFQKVDPHPNIVNFFGLSNINKNCGLVLSYIDGLNLSQLTKSLSEKYINNLLSHSEFWGTIQYIFYHILLGVMHIHKYKFAHQDLKPSNIILDKESLTPIIIDFNRSHECGEVLSPGKEEYASPEFFTSNGKAKISEITDSYSIGQLLYHIYFSSISPETANTFLAGIKTEDLTSKDGNIMLLRMRAAFIEYVKLNNDGQYNTAIKALSHKNIVGLNYEFNNHNNHDTNKLVGCYHEGYKSEVVKFINACMHPNPNLRLTVDDALQHPFITDRVMEADHVKSLLKDICFEDSLKEKTNIQF
jgi:serine/threonine protein kinase